MLKTDITLPYNYSDDEIPGAIAYVAGIYGVGQIENIKILKKTLDVQNGFSYKLTVMFNVRDVADKAILRGRRKTVFPAEEVSYTLPTSVIKQRTIVVGSGPAGIFAALTLAQAGQEVLVLERGDDVDSRQKKVKYFAGNGTFDPESNIQFGEGGAGTFSDGKLKPGKLDSYKYKVLSEFVGAGAPEDILWLSNPHLGTDKLSEIVKNLRKKIISLGGEVRFRTKVTKIIVSGARACGIRYIDGIHERKILADNVIIATGHSARDVFAMLHYCEVPMEQRSFGVGVRIEHTQKYINKLTYGKCPPAGIEAASYHLVTHLENGRSVYSFCMCPGGSVVAATSENGAVVTNGMSAYARDGVNANAAFLVSVGPEDFGSTHPLAGVYFQEKLEKAAFAAGGSDFKAPVQRMEDFMNDRCTSAFGEVLPTYPRGTKFVRADEYLPAFITSSLRQAIRDFDKWMPGFYCPDALLTGVETRTTSPVRVMRDETYQTPNLRGLYPCGEGAGYAGGIVSAAVDGIKCAEQIIKKENFDI